MCSVNTHLAQHAKPSESPMFMTLESLIDELFAKIVSSDGMTPTRPR